MEEILNTSPLSYLTKPSATVKNGMSPAEALMPYP